MTKDFDFKHYFCEFGKYDMKELIEKVKNRLKKLWLDDLNTILYFKNCKNFHMIKSEKYKVYKKIMSNNKL